MRVLGVIILFAAEILRANTIFYDVNFNRDRLNKPPAIGVGTNSPTGGPYVDYSTVVRSFGQLTNRPLLLPIVPGNSIEFLLGRGSPDYTVDFDFETHNLTTNGYFLLTPIFALGGDGQMTAPDFQKYPFTWTDDRAHHLHIVVGVTPNIWSIQLDNGDPISGTSAGGVDLKELDFSLQDYGTNGQAAIDNIVIGTTTNYLPLNVFFPLSQKTGRGPEDRVARDAAGNFYGTAVFGSSPFSLGDYGSVFKTDKHGNLLWVFYFTNDNGANPSGGVTIGDDGFLYGTTAFGGIGTIFKMSQNGQLVWSVPFNGTNGSHPYAGVIEIRNQIGEIELYGTTSYGGAYGNGTVFKLDSSRKIHVLHSFSAGGTDGARPHRLVLGDDGFLYGTTAFDQTNGTIFKISPSGAFFTNLFVFDGTNGGIPMAGLIKFGKHTFYGTTERGGTNFEGTVFRITSSGVLTTLHSFGSPGDNSFTGRSEYGSLPDSELVLGHDGNFYGTTTSGGITNLLIPGNGTVFRISPAGDFQKLADFHGGDGSSPVGAMIEGEAGTFYGTALGLFNYENPYLSPGTVFSISAMRPRIVIDHVSAALSGSGELEITGKTKCDPPVTNVLYRINGDSWLQATTTNAWLTWAGAATLVRGKNTIQAYAVSAFGDRSRTNTLHFKR
jgi:uncharacterized repeat protein (TIGR03803 family)